MVVLTDRFYSPALELQSSLSKPQSLNARRRRLTSQLTIASVLLVHPPFTFTPPFSFTQPPFSLPFSARTHSAGVDSSGVTIGELQLQLQLLLQLLLQLQKTHSSTSSTINRLC